MVILRMSYAMLTGTYCGFCGRQLEGPLKTCKNCGNTMCENCIPEHQKECVGKSSQRDRFGHLRHSREFRYVLRVETLNMGANLFANIEI
jgi:hypothetical protein